MYEAAAYFKSSLLDSLGHVSRVRGQKTASLYCISEHKAEQEADRWCCHVSITLSPPTHRWLLLWNQAADAGWAGIKRYQYSGPETRLHHQNRVSQWLGYKWSEVMKVFMLISISGSSSVLPVLHKHFRVSTGWGKLSVRGLIGSRLQSLIGRWFMSRRPNLSHSRCLIHCSGAADVASAVGAAQGGAEPGAKWPSLSEETINVAALVPFCQLQLSGKHQNYTTVVWCF